MAITIKALRPLSECMGGNKVEIEWGGGTLQDLIQYFVEKKGPEVERELKGEDGSLAYVVSVNGKVHRKLSTPIQDGDEVFFFTPMGGG